MGVICNIDLILLRSGNLSICNYNKIVMGSAFGLTSGLIIKPSFVMLLALILSFFFLVMIGIDNLFYSGPRDVREVHAEQIVKRCVVYCHRVRERP